MTNQIAGTVSVIDTTTNTVVATVTVGAQPGGVGVNPAGTFAYVANNVSGNVSVIDAATNAVVATVTVGQNPIALGLFIGGAVGTGLAPVPTLSEWGMILLALSLLTLGSWRGLCGGLLGVVAPPFPRLALFP